MLNQGKICGKNIIYIVDIQLYCVIIVLQTRERMFVLGGIKLEHVDYFEDIVIPTLELLFDLHERNEISKENVLLIASSICNVDQDLYGDTLNAFAKKLNEYERLKTR